MPTDCSADRFEFARVEGRARGGRVRRRDDHLRRRGAAPGRHRPGDRLGPPVRGLLYRSSRGGSGRAQRGHPGRPARASPWRWATRTWSTTTPCATTRCWPRSPASSPRAAPTARRWPASRRSTGSSTRRPGSPRATTRSAMTAPRSSGCSSSCSSTRTPTPPEEIVLDLDATDDPLHGAQEGRFFHGYYGCYCYLPLYVFCGDHLLVGEAAAVEHRRQRRRGRGDRAAGAPDPRPLAAGADRPARRLRLRARRADELVRGQRGRLRPRPRPQPAPGRRDRSRARPGQGRGGADRQAGPLLQGLPLPDAGQLELRAPGRRQGRAAGRRRRRDQPQPALRRHLAHSRGLGGPAALRAALLRPRRDGKPDQGMPARPVRRPHLDQGHARPTSCACGSPSMAYVLLAALRRIALPATRLARATAGTIRLKLLKIGALVRVSVRRVTVEMASGHPWQHDWAIAHARPHRGGRLTTTQTAHSRHHPMRRCPRAAAHRCMPDTNRRRPDPDHTADQPRRQPVPPRRNSAAVRNPG